MRDDKWLKSQLDEIWKRYFPDIVCKNRVVIKFGRRARTRLGSIKKLPDGTSLIQINALLKIEEAPDFIIQATIAHELVHYSHGFSSPLDQKYDHPHRGGVVSIDMVKRGLGDILVLQKRWLKNNWTEFLKTNYPQSLISQRKKKRKKRKIIFVFR